MLKNVIASFYRKLINSFGDAKDTEKSGHFGLGQFVLLIALAPFIFDLHLYGFKTGETIASVYEYDPYRFESLPALSGASKPPSRPKAPKPLSREKQRVLQFCHASGFFAGLNPACAQIKAESKSYSNRKRAYDKKMSAYRKQVSKYRTELAQRESINKLYKSFGLDISQKPLLPSEGFVKEESQTLTNSLVSNIALDTWQTTGTILWIVGLFLIVPALIYAIQKRCWTLLALGLCVPGYNYVVIITALITGLEQINQYYFNSTVAAQLAFVWFVCKGHVRSKSFGIFLLVMSLSVSIAVFVGSTGKSILVANLPVLVFVMAACVLRYIYLVFRDNFYLIQKKGWINNLGVLSHAIILWIPIGGFALGFFYLTSISIPKAITDKLNQEGMLVKNSRHDFLDNSLQSVAVHTDNFAYSWHLIIESMRIDVQKNASKLKQQELSAYASKTFDKIMPSKLEFSRYRSNAVPVVKEGVELAVNAAQNSTNAAYKRLRSKMKSALIDVVKGQEATIKSSIDSGEQAALEAIEKTYELGISRLMEINYSTQKSLWWLVSTFTALKFLELLILVFVATKSLLYVFARVRFRRESDLELTIKSQGDKAPSGDLGITPSGLRYHIPATKDQYFYISRKFQCRGKAPKFAIPQPISSFLARFANGSYSMNKVEINENGDEITCTATKGMEFFEWKLADGEQVAFDFFNFVGMSNSVSLSTIVSTRISNLLFGKMFYSVATGPGVLVLVSEGRAEVAATQRSSSSLPPERVIACEVNAGFLVDSEIDFVNIYLSSAYLKPNTNSKMIIDVDSMRGLKSGLGGFIRRFLLPF